MTGAALTGTPGSQPLPGLQTVEVCAFGGQNCAGGGKGGILGGGMDSFMALLAGTWGDSVNIGPIGFKCQTGAASSFEFTTTSGQVPEPASATLALLGVALLGAGFGLRGKSLVSA